MKFEAYSYFYLLGWLLYSCFRVSFWFLVYPGLKLVFTKSAEIVLSRIRFLISLFSSWRWSYVGGLSTFFNSSFEKSNWRSLLYLLFGLATYYAATKLVLYRSLRKATPPPWPRFFPIRLLVAKTELIFVRFLYLLYTGERELQLIGLFEMEL